MMFLFSCPTLPSSSTVLLKLLLDFFEAAGPFPFIGKTISF